MRFISIHSVLNILSECIYFYISKNITSYTFLLVYKVVKNRQCILKVISFKHRQLTKIKNRIRLRFLNIYILLAGALRQGHWSSCYYFCKKWSNYNIKSFCFKHKLMNYLSLKKGVEWTIRYTYHNYLGVYFLTNYYLKSKKLMWNSLKPWK